ncbi:hypothetical protein BPUTEOSOX_716 [thiotrophic endosymbiont of Bathymodiolus puteoserpentis (Logatchev)]|nr:hypothetical protein BPUTEOSOX_716 [thiotrophic endosymbiont of Bathymodiolus puteoserpentis (Logatchev)]
MGVVLSDWWFFGWVMQRSHLRFFVVLDKKQFC